MLKEKKIKVFYNTKVTGVKRKGRRIKSIQVISKQHHLNINHGLEFTPKAIIDASGNGAVIKLKQGSLPVSPGSKKTAGRI